MGSDLEIRENGGNALSWPQPTDRTAGNGMPAGGELRSLTNMLRRRRATILFGLITVFGGVTAITWQWPKTYESDAVILVEEPAPGADSPALAMLERIGQNNRIDTEIELLRSRHVLSRTVDELDLHVSVTTSAGKERPLDVFPAFGAGRAVDAGTYRIEGSPERGYTVWDTDLEMVMLESDSTNVAFAGLSITLPPHLPDGGILVNVTAFPRAVEQARSLVSASQLRREADLIGVSCEGSRPLAAQQLCESALRNYIALRTDLQRAEAATTAAFLREQVDLLGGRLRTSENQLESYKRRNSIVALNDRATAEVQQVTEFQARRDALEAERIALESLIRNVENDDRGSRKYRDLASFPTFLMNDAVTELLASLITLENRQSDLAVRRTNRDPDLAALNTRISDIESQLRSLALSYEQSLAEQVRSLDGTLDRSRRKLAVIPTQQVESARLERQTGLIEDLYRMLETRLREAEVAEAVDLPNVRIVDPATEPFDPSAPNVPMNLALGMFLGLAYGLAMALYREFKDPLHERDEVARETGLPVLGIIPRLRSAGPLIPAYPQITNGKDRKKRRRRLPAKRHQQVGELALEAVRGLAAELSFAGTEIENGKICSVAVTGATRGEGKTFTACNLALVRASHGAKTLLIDADIRASSVGQFFDLPTPAPGLSDILAGSADLTDVWQRVKVDGSELWVVPAGTPTPHSVSLLESQAFKTLLARAARYFDLVIIDTPPLSVTTDAATVATRVNAVVLVVRGGISDRTAMEMTMDRLKRARGRVVGVVLNDVPLPPGYISRYSYAEPIAQAD